MTLATLAFAAIASAFAVGSRPAVAWAAGSGCDGAARAPATNLRAEPKTEHDPNLPAKISLEAHFVFDFPDATSDSARQRELVVHVRNATTAPFDGQIRVFARDTELGSAHVQAEATSLTTLHLTLDTNATAAADAAWHAGLFEGQSARIADVATVTSHELEHHDRLTVIDATSVTQVPTSFFPTASRILHTTEHQDGPRTRFTDAEIVTPVRTSAGKRYHFPHYAAGYGSAALVVATPQSVAALTDSEAVALTSWVGLGGTLAIAPGRFDWDKAAGDTSVVGIENVRITRLVGGTIRNENKAPALALRQPGNPSFGSPYRGSTTPLTLEANARGVGYVGANLVQSKFGASARFGSGRVILLPFSLTGVSPFWGDCGATYRGCAPEHSSAGWAEARVAELITDSIEYRRSGSTMFALAPHSSQILQAMTKSAPQLASGLALALALTAFAIGAGPLLYRYARRRRMLFAPLWLTPLIGTSLFGVIAGGSRALRGWHGSARELSYLEFNSGSPHVAVTSYRAFDRPEAGDLLVVPQANASEVGVEHRDMAATSIQRDERNVFRLATRSWTPSIVRERYLADTFGTIRVEDDGPFTRVYNGTPSPLTHLMVRSSNGELHAIAQIRPGESASTTLTPAEPAHDREAWSVWERTALPRWGSNQTDTVVYGIIDDRKGPTSDSGLRIQSRKTVFRVLAAASAGAAPR
jgi:hypothetical protein